MLKSLELFGFKSFADRIRFDFSPGITCVVGPNGSGKSNVVDALKWILGDQSAKSLRGKEMTDVIFNGAANRKASQFSEATLTFDNSSGMLAVDMPEVQIGRRLWRSGDSEYLINQAPVRLKDVRDLFLGTGVGSAAYSIIEQGRVDQILQSNPAGRRAVFEEAAGVSRFKARKQDAERKLERVSQNLVRLSDIVDELEAQLNATRSQAAKAVKFKEVSDELRRWWLGLAADDYRHLSGERARHTADEEQDQAVVDQLTERQQQLEQRQAAFDAELAEVDDVLEKYERRAAQIRESAARHEATIRFQLSRHQELSTEIARLRKQILLLEHRRQQAAQHRTDIEQQLAAAERESLQQLSALTSSEQDKQQALAQAEAAQQQMQAVRERQLQLSQELSARRAEATALEQQLAAFTQTVADLRQRLSEGDAACDEQRQRLEQAEAERQAAQDRLAERKDHLHDVRAQRAELAAASEQAAGRLTELKEQHSAARARKAALEEFERRQEGLGVGVREILKRSETSPLPPWSDVLGNVADLLDVPLEHAALLEVALGERAQLVVIRRRKSLVDYINTGKCTITGRVGFVETPPQEAAIDADDLIVPTAPAGPDLSNEPGVLHRADRLVGDERVPGLARRLLGKTWIVESLDDALRLARDAGRGCRFVTLQGETLEDDGTLFVGTVRHETAVVSRKSELRSLKLELQTIESRIEQASVECGIRAEALDAIDRRLAQDDETVAEAARQLAERESVLAERKRQLQAVTDAAAKDRQQVQQIQQTIEETAAQLEQRRQQVTELEASLAGLKAEMQQAEQAAHQCQQTHQSAEQARSAAQAELAKLRERVESLRHQQRQFDGDDQAVARQRQDVTGRIEASIQRDRQARLLALNASAEMAELCQESDAMLAKSLDWRLQKQRMRQDRGRLTQEEQALRKQRREVEQRQHERSMRLREIDHQLATLAERIEEEYQTTLDELAASDVSAVALLIEERRQRRRGETKADSADTRHADQTDDPTAADSSEHAEVDEAEPVDHLDTDAAGGDAPADQDVAVFEEVREELEQRVGRLRRKLKALGSVNADSLRDLEELDRRYEHLRGQLQDLEEAKAALEDIIRRINIESRRLFNETFEDVRKNFQDLFRKIFGGGEADIILEDPEDALECGIDIKARPPGKELRNLSLLSGGEKTMTAIALVMAIFRSKPSPFCILDEVDAALDEANVERFANVLKEFRESTQFIMISHHKRTMSVADVLYGVTMEQSGVSKRMSVRFEDVADDGNIIASAA